jgi:hypothetical protein
MGVAGGHPQPPVGWPANHPKVSPPLGWQVAGMSWVTSFLPYFLDFIFKICFLEILIYETLKIYYF